MLVSVIIVNYNTGKILKECINSIYNFEKEIELEIIIVDNSSTDNSKIFIENLAGQQKEIKTIFLNTKISFSAANNEGFELSSGKYILIMNPDIIFTEPVLQKLLDDLNFDERVGVVSPLLIGTDGQFQRRYFQRYPTLLQFIFFYSVLGSFFFRFPSLVNKYLENHDINVNSNKTEHVEQIPCAFFLTTRKVFGDAKKMDERYSLFFEDVDLSFQINKKYNLAVDSSMKVTHLGGESFKTSDDFWLHGKFIMGMITFFDKNYSAFKTFILKSLAVSNSYLILLIESIKKIFGKEDEYRTRKHKFFLREFRKTYL